MAMRREICWFERDEERVKRNVRVSFHGRNRIQWDIRRSDAEPRAPSELPTKDDWAELERRAADWYCRRALPIEILELIKRQRALEP